MVSHTTQLKLTASDGKKYNTDVISQDGVDKLAKAIHNQQAIAKAEKEFEIYRKREMDLLESDFDREIKKLKEKWKFAQPIIK